MHNQIALLSQLKDRLLPDGHHPRDTLDRYSAAVNEAFERPGRLRFLNINELMEDQRLDRWRKAAKSCILLLRGSTLVTTVDYSWLSPAFFHLVDRFLAQDRVVIFHCCHDRVHMDSDTPAYVVLSILVFQLLEAETNVLQDRTKYEELVQDISNPKWRANSPALPFTVLKRLLSTFEEVCIMLDRVDRIRGSADRFMDPLVKLVLESKSRIKIFLVASSNPHNLSGEKVNEDVIETLAEELGSEQFFDMILDQK